MASSSIPVIEAGRDTRAVRASCIAALARSSPHSRSIAAAGIGAALLGLGDGSANLAGTAYQALIATRFSRGDETEADRIGLELSARAGYDPRAGITLWKKMLSGNQGGRPPEFLSTHPAETRRIQQIEELLPAVMPLYEAARKGR